MTTSIEGRHRRPLLGAAADAQRATPVRVDAAHLEVQARPGGARLEPDGALRRGAGQDQAPHGEIEAQVDVFQDGIVDLDRSRLGSAAGTADFGADTGACAGAARRGGALARHCPRPPAGTDVKASMKSIRALLGCSTKSQRTEERRRS